MDDNLKEHLIGPRETGATQKVTTFDQIKRRIKLKFGGRLPVSPFLLSF